MNSSRASWSQLSIPQTSGGLSLRFVSASVVDNDSLGMQLNYIFWCACIFDCGKAHLIPVKMVTLCYDLAMRAKTSVSALGTAIATSF